ncbi:MAG: branched-chain amino acid ABC transporter permease [Candidatus Bathyarchaeota archaeon]
MIQELMRTLVLGAIRGGTYSLLSLGFTLIYGISGIINLSYGSLYMLATFVFYTIAVYILLGTATTIILVFVLVVSVIIVAVIGAFLYRTTIHQVMGDEVAVMVVTVCVALILQEIIKIGFGSPPVNVGWPPGSVFRDLRQILGVVVSNAEILAGFSSLAIFVMLFVLIKKTKIGNAMTAISQDREAAMLMGVNTDRLYMLTMAISAMLAGVAGILITTSTTTLAFPFMWMQPLFSAFSIVILGGLGSIKGSLVGGFIIAYSEVAFTIFVDAPIAGVAPLSIMVLVLLLRPKGLFGKRIEMED